MKSLLTAVLLGVCVSSAAGAADTPQKIALSRGSATDRLTGVVLNGNSLVLVYGSSTSGMVSNQQALRITPNGDKIDVIYDTVGALGVPTQGLTPVMMMMSGGFMWPVYNMGDGGAN